MIFGAELLRVLLTILKFSKSDRIYKMLIQLVKQANASNIAMMLSMESALMSSINSLKKMIRLENRQKILLRNKFIFQNDINLIMSSSGPSCWMTMV